jgi:polysaccharide biosynthesis/export protein
MQSQSLEPLFLAQLQGVQTIMMQLARYAKHVAETLLILALLATAVSAQQKGAASSGGFGSGAAGPIGAGDLVEMSMFDTPELSGKLRVSNTGDVILPLIGSVHVAGLSANDMQHLIRQKFMDGRFVKDPQVTVFVSEYATEGVSVLGQVKVPGVYPALGAHNLVDYLSMAGGLTPLAGTNITIAHVGRPNEPEHVKISTAVASSPLDNPPIVSGDSIFVEKTGLIYVIGDVVRPGAFPMDHDEHLTILQALALAQGTTYAAKSGASIVIRTTAQGHQAIPVDLKKILASKASDSLLQDNDILFVPNSGTKVALKNIESLLPVATSAALFRVP